LLQILQRFIDISFLKISYLQNLIARTDKHTDRRNQVHGRQSVKCELYQFSASATDCTAQVQQTNENGMIDVLMTLF